MKAPEFEYPTGVDFHTLTPVGDPPYFSADAARELYDTGKPLEVLRGGEPREWLLRVSPRHHRFSVTYYSDRGTPLRDVTWESDGDDLLRRKTIDLFYPDGDPARRLPYVEIISVTHNLSADGVVGVTLATPIGDDEFREVTGVTLASFRTTVPAFGEWDALVAAGAPPTLERFGLDAIDAIDAALGLAQQVAPSVDDAAATNRGWSVATSVNAIMDELDAVLAQQPTSEAIIVLERGAARILPLTAGADPTLTGRDPREEHRRAGTLASSVRDACDHREGWAVQVDLDDQSVDSVASYSSALRAAGATRAHYWRFDDLGVVLVQSGAAEAATLTLALHVVPLGWVLDRRAGAPVAGIDVRWSLSDLIS